MTVYTFIKNMNEEKSKLYTNIYHPPHQRVKQDTQNYQSQATFVHTITNHYSNRRLRNISSAVFGYLSGTLLIEKEKIKMI
jgi:hypothetical protein